MAAFTTFKREQLERYLIMFSKGDLLDYAPIATGIENSNYTITLNEQGVESEYVLTILEGMDFGEPAYFGELMTRLQNEGLPVAPPEKTLDGMSTTIFCGKPTILSSRLPGRHPDPDLGEPDILQCRAIGAALAQIHQANPKLSKHRENPYHLAWLQETINRLDDLKTVEKALALAIAQDYAALLDSETANSLPRTIVHADLFPDNTLFEGDQLTGILDFYHACTDFCIEDLAITINAWCRQGNAQLDQDRLTAMRDAYQSIRALTPEEKSVLPLMLRSGALRFFLTRHLSKEGQQDYLKDPAEFRRIMEKEAREPANSEQLFTA
ncbi:MAG: homoserine kinase [Gammaproteobacteria bacterium]|nr:homoserine kinase [Gammaproteobacteria bacterium]